MGKSTSRAQSSKSVLAKVKTLTDRRKTIISAVLTKTMKFPHLHAEFESPAWIKMLKMFLCEKKRYKSTVNDIKAWLKTDCFHQTVYNIRNGQGIQTSPPSAPGSWSNMLEALDLVPRLDENLVQNTEQNTELAPEEAPLLIEKVATPIWRPYSLGDSIHMTLGKEEDIDENEVDHFAMERGNETFVIPEPVKPVEFPENGMLMESEPENVVVVKSAPLDEIPTFDKHNFNRTAALTDLTPLQRENMSNDVFMGNLEPVEAADASLMGLDTVTGINQQEEELQATSSYENLDDSQLTDDWNFNSDNSTQEYFLGQISEVSYHDADGEDHYYLTEQEEVVEEQSTCQYTTLQSLSQTSVPASLIKLGVGEGEGLDAKNLQNEHLDDSQLEFHRFQALPSNSVNKTPEEMAGQISDASHADGKDGNQLSDIKQEQVEEQATTCHENYVNFSESSSSDTTCVPALSMKLDIYDGEQQQQQQNACNFQDRASSKMMITNYVDEIMDVVERIRNDGQLIDAVGVDPEQDVTNWEVVYHALSIIKFSLGKGIM